MPADLAQQIEPLHQAIAASGWNLLMLEGVEADDVIGTLAQQARDGVRCVIATGDKDLAQLVNERVTLINTMSNETLDIAGVNAKFGVPPERIVDYLTLTGDTVDNVPGVDKVGPKTAVKWLTQYGTLDNLMQHAGEIGGVVGENLRKALDWLPQARRLITVKCDVELPQTYSELIPPPADKEQLRSLFERFEFKTWLREFNGGSNSLPGGGGVTMTCSCWNLVRWLHRGGASQLRQRQTPCKGEGDGVLSLSDDPPTRTDSAHYETILTEAQLDAWLEKILAAELVCVDTETTGLDMMNAQLVGMSFAITPHQAAYLPLAHIYPGAPDQLNRAHALQKLKPWLESAQHHKLGQNLKYDMHIFANHGIALAGIHEDTLLQSYVLESHKPHDMDNLALRHLNVKTISFADVAGKGAKQICFDQVDIDTATHYAAEDADITLQLHQNLSPQIEAQSGLQHVYRDIEMPSMHVLYTMERNGVLLDSALLQIQSRELGEKLIALEARAHEARRAAVQPEFAQADTGNPVRQTRPAGSEKNPERHALHRRRSVAGTGARLPAAEDAAGISRHGETQIHLHRQTAADGGSRNRTRAHHLLAGGGGDRAAGLQRPQPAEHPDPHRRRPAHPRSLHRAARAAASCPPTIRRSNCASWRICPAMQGLLKAFANNEDIHRATAAEIFMVAPAEVSSEQRRYAKVINFGLIYGMSAFGLAKQLGIERSAAQRLHRPLFRALPRREELHGQHARTGQTTGLCRDRVRPPPVAAGNQQQQRPCAARVRNAPRSTRRCRARRPT